MRPLAASDLDRMAHLDDVHLVRIERLSSERIEPAWRRRRCSMCHPAHDRARDKRDDHCCGRGRTPGARAAGEPVEVEACRDRFGGECTEVRTDSLRLRPPLGDASSIFRMGGKPRLDGASAVGRKLAVDIGVQLLFGHAGVSIDHDRLPYLI